MFSPGMTGISFPGLPSGVPSAPGPPQVPGGIPTRMTPPGLGAGLGLPSLPTQSSPCGMIGFSLSPDQLPVETQNSSSGESRGCTPQIPGLETRFPPTVPQVNSAMLRPVLSQVSGIPTDITSATEMVPPSTKIRFPGAADLGMGGYGGMIPGPQVKSGILPPVSSQVAGMPTDLTSPAGIVPPSTSISSTGREMIPGSQVNVGTVRQDGLFPSSTAIPTGTQCLGDTMIPINLDLPPNMPNTDLLVRIEAMQIHTVKR